MVAHYLHNWFTASILTRRPAAMEVRKSNNPWFFGPVGPPIRHVQEIEFVPARGMLGFFNCKADPAHLPPQPKWM